MEARNLRKQRQGVVTSDKMDKTIVVSAKFKEKHPIYGKLDLGEMIPPELYGVVAEILVYVDKMDKIKSKLLR